MWGRASAGDFGRAAGAGHLADRHHRLPRHPRVPPQEGATHAAEAVEGVVHRMVWGDADTAGGLGSSSEVELGLNV